MSLPEAALVLAVRGLLEQAGLGGARFELVPLSGGANNQVYRIEGGEHPPLVLKHYFYSAEDPRDRFQAEKAFYDFLSAAGCAARAPQALAWNREDRLGLFSWVEGRRLLPAEVAASAVEQALAFYLSLNANQHLPEARSLTDASEACFDLQQHFDCVDRRVGRLEGVKRDSTLGAEVLDFVSIDLKPALAAWKGRSLKRGDTRLWLEADRRCVSPSDFGFHNALQMQEGDLVFLDFEYAGWDDPSKFLCDFLCQPAVPVPRSLWRHCVEAICRPIPGGCERERVATLLPLYHLKWCCILLNEFLPRDQNRRAFSQKFSLAELETKKAEQLNKARELFKSMAFLDPLQNSGIPAMTGKSS
jgi:hypothetical protein